MNNKKTTKRALVSSVLSLVLCMAMLIGTTFAWFTDSVTSGNNKIVAGNLDIELEYYTGSGWATVEGASELFTDNLWEPGHTEVVYLKMINKGTLALKYQLGVNIVSETGSVNAEGDNFKLSQYIEYGVVEGKQPSYAKREDAVAAVKDDSIAIAGGYSKSGNMTTKGQEVYLAMVVYMPETVGNEANYATGEAVPTINLGVNLVATQYTYESDSYNNQYDKDAIYYDALVSNESELHAAVAAASGDYVIAISDSITLTKNLVNSLNKGRSADKLNSIKFVGLSEDVVVDQGTYIFQLYNTKVTLENLTLTHGEKQYGDGGQASTTFCVWNASEVNYINCIFERSVGTLHAAVHNFIGCTFNGVEDSLTKGEYPLYNYHSGETNVIDCVFNCTGKGAILFYGDNYKGTFTMNISDTIFHGDIQEDKAAVEIHSLGADYIVNFDNVATGTGIVNGLYRIKPASVEGKVTVNGATVVSAVTSQEEINDALASGTDVVLADDVEAPLTESAIYGTPVAIIQENGGTIDGNGYSLDIKNPQYEGYAIETYGGTIKNLTIDSTVGRGIVISSPDEDIYIDNVVIDGPGYAINTTEHSAKNLVVTNSTIKGWSSFAGLASATFTNCTFGENTSKYWQNMGYDQDYDRLVRPYVTTVFTDCEFENGFYVDLSALAAGETITFENCTVDGVVLDATNYSQYITIENYDSAYVFFK